MNNVRVVVAAGATGWCVFLFLKNRESFGSIAISIGANVSHNMIISSDCWYGVVGALRWCDFGLVFVVLRREERFTLYYNIHCCFAFGTIHCRVGVHYKRFLVWIR